MACWVEHSIGADAEAGHFSRCRCFGDTLAQIANDGSVVLLTHVPDIVPKLPWRYLKRLAYGHGSADRRDLVVSGGIGCSLAPVQFGVTPEITLVTLEAAV